MALPQSIRPAESRKPALGGDPGASQDNDVADVRHGSPLPFGLSQVEALPSLFRRKAQQQFVKRIEEEAMLRRVIASLLALFSAPAFAQELDWVPPDAVIGHSYFSPNTPSQILFINVRNRPVKILWVAFDGTERQYAELAEGQQVLQPTFVAHRWIVRDAGDGTPLEGFISTRAAAHSHGSPQIALIR
jgi:hypothetical protein